MTGRAAPTALLLLVLLALAGCGGDDDVPPPAVGLRLVAGAPAPGAAEVFERFLDAAARGDAVTMWGLLSEPTRASIGPTLDEFRWSAALELRDAAGEFVGERRPVVARAFDSQWAVAAVAGEVEDDDGERDPAAYAAALRREELGWRLELNGIFFAWHSPPPLADVSADDPPVLGVVAQSSERIDRMLVWLDGEPAASRAWRPQPFVGVVEARAREPLAPGVHFVTVFAVTEETAAAQAWPFEVEP